MVISRLGKVIEINVIPKVLEISYIHNLIYAVYLLYALEFHC